MLSIYSAACPDHQGNCRALGNVLCQMALCRLGAVPAVHSDGVVSRLLLLLLHSCNDADHALPVAGNPHFRPAMEVELPDLPALVFLWRQEVREAGQAALLPTRKFHPWCTLPWCW